MNDQVTGWIDIYIYMLRRQEGSVLTLGVSNGPQNTLYQQP